MKKEKSGSKKLQTIEQELGELKALLQRTQADFANHRRRVEEDKANFVKLANSGLVCQILPILDNFSLAAKHVPKEIEGNTWVAGVQAIEKQLEQVLTTNGLEKIRAVGEQFDPRFHEAISEICDKKHKDNEIINEELAGYKLHGKLLRPVKVVVNKVNK
jgi:molecular chaperone GrpE